jgi:proteasome lid subunit RPN8/RPN11
MFMDYRSEDSLDLGLNNAFSQCVKHALSHPNEEIGGVFYFNKSFSDFNFLKMKSRNTIEKGLFSYSDSEFYKLYEDKRIISLFHSHHDVDSNLSQLDKEVSQSLNLPSYVFSLKSKSYNLYYPKLYKPRPLKGRIFIPTFQDCITFVKDFFLLELNINLHDKIDNWARHRTESNQKLMNILDNHFMEIDKCNIKYGDILVLHPNVSEHYHLAIYIESHQIYHHVINALPKKEFITPEDLNKVYKVYRYKAV